MRFYAYLAGIAVATLGGAIEFGLGFAVFSIIVLLFLLGIVQVMEEVE